MLKFFEYDQIFLIYSKYINTATREVVFVELAIPNVAEVEKVKEIEEGKFIFEPNLDELINSVSAKLRYALFRQQILDSKLSLYTAQMLAMKTALIKGKLKSSWASGEGFALASSGKSMLFPGYKSLFATNFMVSGFGVISV